MPPEENDPTEEQIKAEIKAAVDILRSDGMHIHKTYAEFQKSLNSDPDPAPDPKEGDPPPPKPEPKDPPTSGKRGIWWGSRV